MERVGAPHLPPGGIGRGAAASAWRDGRNRAGMDGGNRAKRKERSDFPASVSMANERGEREMWLRVFFFLYPYAGGWVVGIFPFFFLSV